MGWYLDRAANGEDILVTRHGTPWARVSAARPRLVPPQRQLSVANAAAASTG